MKYLLIKLFRDLKRNWTQFFSVFFMAFLSVLVFVGLQGVWGGLDKTLQSFISEQGLADAWLYSTGFTEADVLNIKGIDGVTDVSEIYSIDVQDTTDGGKEKNIAIRSFEVDAHTSPYLVEGETLHSESGFIWLNQAYGEANQLAVNDVIQVTISESEVDLTIAGFILSSDRIYFTGTQEFIAPNALQYGYGLVSMETIENQLGYIGLPNVLEIHGDSQSLRIDSERILRERHIAYYDHKTLNEVSEAFDRVDQIRNLSFMFSFIFILLAILAMYTTIKRLIDTQSKEIAVLQALGFSNRQVGGHYASYGFLIGGLGVLCGICVSPFLSNFVLDTQKAMLAMPDWQVSYNYLSPLVCLMVLLVCTLAAFLASRKARNGLPADFLKRGHEKQIRKTVLEKSETFWGRLSYESRWGIRDASINKTRILMGIVGVSGGMMLIMAGLGMPESIQTLIDKAYHEDFTYHYRLNTNQMDLLEESFKGQSVQILPARYSPDDGHNRLLMIIEEGDFIHMQTHDGERIKKGGIYLTEGFATRANIEKGNLIDVYPAFHDQSFSFEVKGIITSETNQGAYIFSETWEEAGGVYTPHTLLVGDQVTFSDIESAEMVTSSIAISDQKQNAYDFVASLEGIFSMIIAFAVVLVIVVLYNLGTLNFVERTRDYTTLSVLGFSKRELRRITMIENVVTTGIGWLIGIPAGAWFLGQYVQTFSTIQIDYTPYLSVTNVAIASIIVWVCSLSTTFFVSRRIQRLDLVAALKDVD